MPGKITEAKSLVAHNVARLRSQRQLSVPDLATAMNWPVEAIEAIERAERADITLDDVDALARALAVEPIELLQADNR